MPEPTAHAVYGSGKVAHSQTHLFPSLSSAFAGPGDDLSGKSLVLVQRCAPAQFARRLPIRVMLLARLTHAGPTWVEPISPMPVLRALATSTMVYAPGWSQSDLNGVTELVRRVPCYHLGLGTELKRIPEVIGGVIDAAQAAAPPAPVSSESAALAMRA